MLLAVLDPRLLVNELDFVGPHLLFFAKPDFQHIWVLDRNMYDESCAWFRNPQFWRICMTKHAQGFAILNCRVQICGNDAHGLASDFAILDSGELA